MDSAATGAPAVKESVSARGLLDLRPLTTEAEFAACVRMQREIWGDDYGELVPPIILQIAQKVGGVAVGAFDGTGRMLGFVFGITGVKDGRLVHWSHILAVEPEMRNTGLGRRLKEYQRDLLIPLGVELIYWTFDPLVAKNAHLNLNRLGAEVVEYVVDMYGRTGSALHALGTDRLVVAWRIAGAADASGPLASQPAAESVGRTTSQVGSHLFTDAAAHLASQSDSGAAPADRSSPAPPAPIVNLTANGEPLGPAMPLPSAPRVRIAIPADIEGMLRESPDLARAWQGTVQRSFLHYLGAGYRVTGFERAAGAGRCYYNLSAMATDGGGRVAEAHR
jgi:predicted GNAT superfamily acetyltransferase